MRGHLLHPEKMEWVDRGSGVASMPLFGGHTDGAKFAIGMTRFPPGAAVILHSHNVDESVTVIEGSGRAEIDGQEFEVDTFSHELCPRRREPPLYEHRRRSHAHSLGLRRHRGHAHHR